MRWNAFCLCASLLVILPGLGCKQFSKKDANAQTAESVAEVYTPPSYGGPVEEFNPYAVEPAPAIERSYPALTAVPEPLQQRFHTVVKRDTLYKLARAYYDDASRWKDIYQANRADVSDPNRILIGQRLLIP